MGNREGRVKVEDFPDHKSGLYLTHNIHRNYYMTVRQMLEDGHHHEIDESDWVNDDDIGDD